MASLEDQLRKLQPYISAASRKYGVPENLIRSVITQESGGNLTAQSGAGAQGLMQLMPATAKSLGVTDPFDPMQNIDAGTKYLKQNIDRFGLEKGLAAYNAGPGNVQKYGGVPPFKETQNYVNKILKNTLSNPEPSISPSSNTLVDSQGNRSALVQEFISNSPLITGTASELGKATKITSRLARDSRRPSISSAPDYTREQYLEHLQRQRDIQEEEKKRKFDELNFAQKVVATGQQFIGGVLDPLEQTLFGKNTIGASDIAAENLPESELSFYSFSNPFKLIDDLVNSPKLMRSIGSLGGTLLEFAPALGAAKGVGFGLAGAKFGAKTGSKFLAKTLPQAFELGGASGLLEFFKSRGDPVQTAIATGFGAALPVVFEGVPAAMRSQFAKRLANSLKNEFSFNVSVPRALQNQIGAIGPQKPIDEKTIAEQLTEQANKLRKEINLPFITKEGSDLIKKNVDDAYRLTREGVKTPEALQVPENLNVVEKTLQKIKPMKGSKDIRFSTATEALQKEINNLNLPEAEKASMVNTVSSVFDDIYKQTRGKVSFAEMDEAAKGLFSDFNQSFLRKALEAKPGTIFKAEEIRALGGYLNNMSSKVEGIGKQLLTDPNNTKLAQTYKDALSTFYKVSRVFEGAKSEAGRSLGALRDIKAVLDPTDIALQKLLKVLPESQTEKLALAMSKAGPTASDKMKVISEFMPSTFTDKLIEYSTAVKLYNPTTHVVNSVSNAMTAILRPLERGVGGVIAGTEAKLTSKQQQIYATNAARDAYATLTAVPQAIKNMWGALKDETFSAGTQRTGETFIAPSIKGMKGQAIRMSFRLLNAGDQFFRTLNTRGELAWQAYNEGMRKGLKGKALEQYANNLMRNPTPELQKIADDVASEYLFQSELGTYGKAAQQFLNKAKALKLIVPFFKTPVNLTKFGLKRTPLGVFAPSNIGAVLKGGQEERALAAARVIVGSTLGAYFTTEALAGNLTGAAPKGKKERNIFFNIEKKQPYSIKIGNTWYSYQRLEPFGINLSLVADSVQKYKDRGIKPSSDVVLEIMQGLGQKAVEMPYLMGVRDLLNAIQDEKRVSSFAANLLGGLIPSPVGAVARATDPYLRQPDTLVERLKTKIPGLSEEVSPRLNLFGEPIERTPSGVESLINPFKRKESTFTEFEDFVKKFDINKADLFGRVTNGVTLPMDIWTDKRQKYGAELKGVLSKISATKGENLKEVFAKLSPEDKKEIAEIVGVRTFSAPAIAKSLSGLTKQAKLTDLMTSKEGMTAFLNKIVTKFGNYARYEAFMEYLPNADETTQKKFLNKKLEKTGPAQRRIEIRKLKNDGLFTPIMEEYAKEQGWL